MNEYGEFPGFIEIINTGNETINLKIIVYQMIH